jgi:hypothetical protein
VLLCVLALIVLLALALVAQDAIRDPREDHHFGSGCDPVTAHPEPVPQPEALRIETAKPRWKHLAPGTLARVAPAITTKLAPGLCPRGSRPVEPNG